MSSKKGVFFSDDGALDAFDPDNTYKDPVAMLEMREYLVREKWIKSWICEIPSNVLAQEFGSPSLLHCGRS